MEDNALIIADLEAEIVRLQRREMRLRSVLSSALASPEKRQSARVELEQLLEDSRDTEQRLSELEAKR